jgi:putative Holliday junction resolvase
MRILGIDYGDQRIGLALSDVTGTLVGRAWTLHEWNLDRAIDAIADVVRENEVGTLVLGLPKNMDGSEGPRAEKSRTVAERLTEATGLDVVLWDERRSSVEAHAILHANGRKEKKHRERVDAVAASLILEGYLGTLGGSRL